METMHNQLPFRLADDTHVNVDEGLYELLMLLRDLGVKTLYSCQGSSHSTETFYKVVDISAYVTVDANSAQDVVAKLMLMQGEHTFLSRLFHDPVHVEYCIEIDGVTHQFQKRDPQSNKRYHFNMQLWSARDITFTLRWPPSDTAAFVKILKEISNG